MKRKELMESCAVVASEDPALEQALAEHLKAYPLGAGQPADVAAAASFLLSGESRWVTGVTLPVDGGFSIH